MAEATLGCVKTIETVHGNVSVNVPAGSQHGTTLRIAGQGMPDPEGGQNGDHKLEIGIQIPTTLTTSQRALFCKLMAEDV